MRDRREPGDGLVAAAAAVYARSSRHQRRVEAAREHMRQLAAHHPHIAVSWSGGSDSTACLKLAAETWTEGLVIMGWHCDQARPEVARLVAEWRDRAPHLEILLRPAVAGWHARHEEIDIDPEAERADRARLARLLHRLDVRHMVLGLRRDESRYRRRIASMIDPHTRSYRAAAKWGGHVAHCPILDWSAEDVRLFLAETCRS